jgi:uncharacterized protein YidB (DUF937 family)
MEECAVKQESNMGFLEDAIGAAVPGGDIKKPLLIALGALLASGALHRSGSVAPGSSTTPSPPGESDGGLLAGLGGLLNKFQQSGQGDIMKSWIGSGPNRDIAPHQLGAALGPEIIKALSEKSGLSQADLTAQLSQILPGLVDKLTPAGRLPTQAEIAAAR